MIEIIKLLMSYGFDFEYENNGSMGEKIMCYQLGTEVSNQQGKIYFSIAAPTEVFEETEGNYRAIKYLIEQECIAETT